MASFSAPLQWLLISILFGSAFAQLSDNYYSKSCPQAFSIIQSEVKAEISKENRLGPSLLRLHIVDCLIGGCDASNLLDDTKSLVGEKSVLGNNSLSREYEIIDRIKAKLEKACPGVVSCADILAVIARDSVVTLGGPNWKVPVGRRDSMQAYKSKALALIPVLLADLSVQITSFGRLGFTKKEFVALIGSHTVGIARCPSFRKRIYEEKNIDPAYAKSLQAICPMEGGDNNAAPLDSTTPFVFDNAYYTNLVKQKGLLTLDQQLYTGKGGCTDSIVTAYSSNQTLFFQDYVNALIKFGKVEVITGNKGQVRTNCRRLNGATN